MQNITEIFYEFYAQGLILKKQIKKIFKLHQSHEHEPEQVEFSYNAL